MDFIRPAALPDFLDSLLASLPDPLYNLTVTFLSHSIALIAAVYDLTASLVSSGNSNWDAQKLLPPIITILAAYLALSSLYRTTTWAFRLAFWFIKWGGIIGLLAAGAGWFVGSNGLSSLLGTGAISTISSLLWNAVNSGEDRDSRSSSRSRNRQRTPYRAGDRPSVWDSFDRHREWQAEVNAEAEERSPDVVQDILNIANKYIGSGGWGQIIDSVKESLEKASEEDGRGDDSRDGRRRQPPRQAKAKTRTPR